MTQVYKQFCYTESEKTVKFTGHITPLAGCPDVAISHNVWTETPGSGCGAEANLVRCRQLKETGYSAVICTVNVDNQAQKKILLKTGWSFGLSFHSRRTGHKVEIWTKEL